MAIVKVPIASCETCASFLPWQGICQISGLCPPTFFCDLFEPIDEAEIVCIDEDTRQLADYDNDAPYGKGHY